MKDEEDNVLDLIEELEPIMNDLQTPWELLCVDDGSTDATGIILKDLQKSKKYLRVIAFSNHFGQSSAFDAGFKAAKGDTIITMDGDRQNDPHDIPKLLEAMDDCDLVCGRRHQRQDSLLKKIISKVANKVRSRLCGDGMQDTGCSLKAYRASCLHQIKMYHGMHRFLPALFTIEGFRTKQIDVNHRQRLKGSTKYNLFNRSFNTVADLFAVVWMRKRRLNYTIHQEIP